MENEIKILNIIHIYNLLFDMEAQQMNTQYLTLKGTNYHMH